MKSLSKEELLKILNTDYATSSDTVIDLLKAQADLEEYDSLCAECDYQTVQKRAGDEGWTWCAACQLTEGYTYQVTIIPALGIAYNWTKKYWLPQNEDMGSSL